MNRQYFFITVAACLLSACAQQVPVTGTPAAPPQSGAGACNATGAQFAVGKSADASLVEQARSRSGAYMARVLRPGQAVTMEFNPQRLNLDVDASNVVTRARCG